ncbi:5-oxoprolinase subunit PxpB [Ancylobacter pratisalsi]|uniref:5-oxoprolinase subunit PxpB n=1 Tax=Ancylobacter pratisalsi TaxID=1745854 RepID=A0A6P1YMW0_9HYPH|nr:5-oxoprolinase subunit PxpB [Ancylobacter pratisalsi]QIB33573.1 5-oxoprolinase subunit PxpB [Ancylobacter pratisalsi]
MNPSSPAFPRLLDAGESGLVVEFGSDIDAAVNERVIALDRALARHPVAGICETVPTYRSLLVLFDPLVIARAALAAHVLACESALEQAPTGAEAGTLWRVPVLYGGAHGVDLEAVAQQHGLSPEALIALHSGALYRVYMIGFAPGFAYLGGLPEAIHTSRRTDPRPKTPERSISIGGRQAAISPPIEVPSGWHLLGQTPVRSYDPARAQPFLFAAGDRIRFAPIDAPTYRDMLAAAEAGEIVASRESAPGGGPDV